MDEDTTKPLDEEVVEDQTQDDAQEETPEEVQDEVQEETVEDEPVVETPEETPEEQPPSRREQLRINQLLQKYGPPKEEQAPKNDGVDYRSMIDADDEVYDQLGKATQDYGTKQYQQGLEQAKTLQFQTRLEIDAPKVASKYPQLDKDSPDFNPVTADALNNMYLSSVGYDPNTGKVQNTGVRYADYIDAMFELVDEVSSRKVHQAQKNITKQAARTGIRPDGSTAKRLDLSKPVEAMTDEELDAYGKTMGLNPKKR